MSSEKLLPTNLELEEHIRRMDGIDNRAKVAAGVAAVSAAAAGVFLPAVGGSLVGLGEGIRLMKKLKAEIVEFHQKYPGLDK